MTRIISIEGNIGSGKSTFVKEYQKYCMENFPKLNIYFLQEPVDIWNNIKNSEGKNVIECYYENQEKYAFPFQMMAYISRIHLLKEALLKNYDIIVTERCVYTDKNVFAQMLYDENKIGEIEFKIYNMWFEEFLKDLPEIEIIYLKTNPEISNERVLKRSRKGENIPIDYLKSCHDYHEKWLNNHKPIITLNADDDIKNYSNYISKMKHINDNLLNFDNNSDDSNDNSTYNIYFDGASRGNPGPSGIGFVVYLGDEKIYQHSEYIGDNLTNNYAEYTAVNKALQWCISKKIKNLIIKGDSQLVIKQLKKEYEVNSDNLKEIYSKTLFLLDQIEEYNLFHIDRKFNKEADKLANLSFETLNQVVAN